MSIHPLGDSQGPQPTFSSQEAGALSRRRGKVVRTQGGVGGGEEIDQASQEEGRGAAKGERAKLGQTGSWKFGTIIIFGLARPFGDDAKCG